MKILYHFPHPTIYAGRTIYTGYKNAFEDMGHQFATLTADDRNQKELFANYAPDIFITSLHRYFLKYLDLEALEKAKKKGTKVFVNVPFWSSPMSKIRINEAPSLKNDKRLLELVTNGLGHVYYNVCEENDDRMEGFAKTTGYKHVTIPLAADKIALKPHFVEKFVSDIAFVGTYLPDKRKFFNECVFPLGKKYNLRIYGQDWTLEDRLLGWIQRLGQYFNVPYLKKARKPKLAVNEEADIYKSSLISINVHENYQRLYGGDCNERTFKIPLSGGFEITDDVACIRKYFKEGEEIVIAKNKDDWFDKIYYYIKQPEERQKIIEAGRARVLAEHTYHNRIQKIIDIYNTLI